ncbi:Armadillo-like helical [Corchorus olitorius]|uniref:Armadillo-like helical n=1 Tax=Corchorus olitorius TaxID=93759 RepID=A0A1R3I4T4_9ROSI|nr:Armadillo-like helical [Corchorus olitorius]
MEAEEVKRKKYGRSRKRKKSSSDSEPNTTILPLLMASTYKQSLPLLKKCLYKFHRSFLSQPHEEEAPPLAVILSLCPLLLNYESPEIASLTAEIVGAASLMSFHMNQQVVSDSPTLKALISLIPTSPNSVSTAACNALLDLCSSSLGRHRLLHSSALKTLMTFGLLEQITKQNKRPDGSAGYSLHLTLAIEVEPPFE